MEFTGRHGRISPEKLQNGLHQTDQNGKHDKYQLWMPRQGLSRPDGIGVFSGAIAAISGTSGTRQTGQPSLLIAHSDKVEGFGIGAPNVTLEWGPPPPLGSGYEAPVIGDTDFGVFGPFFHFNWGGLDYVDHWDVLEDDVKVDETTDTEYSFDDPDAGDHRYGVQPVYEDGTVGDVAEVPATVTDPGWTPDPTDGANDVYDDDEGNTVGEWDPTQGVTTVTTSFSRPFLFSLSMGVSFTLDTQPPSAPAGSKYWIVRIKVNFLNGDTVSYGFMYDSNLIATGYEKNGVSVAQFFFPWDTSIYGTLSMVRTFSGSDHEVTGRFVGNSQNLSHKWDNMESGVSSWQVLFGSTQSKDYEYLQKPRVWGINWS